MLYYLPQEEQDGSTGFFLKGVPYVKRKQQNRPDRARKRPYSNKSSLTVYLILRGLVILSAIRAFFRQDYQSVFLCILSLALMLMPSILSRKLDIRLPGALEIVILLFIFAAEILGEINSFYVRVPHWDTMLHTMNGFLCAAIGFALVDMMNRSERFSLQLSPKYLALTAFCFSMTVGVLWEFFEFSGDHFLGLDMQKDTVVNALHSVVFDDTRTNTVVHIREIADVIIVHTDGSRQTLGIGGYLDIGIYDTMKDLLVNLIGAVVFSVIGYIAASRKGKSKIASQFIPQVITGQDPQ